MRLLLPPSRTVRDEIGASAPIDHYSGVLYRALEVDAWTAAERRYALAHLVLHDREAGLVGAGRWDRLDPTELGGFVLDARSQEYVRLVRLPRRVWSLRVVTEDGAGRRLAVSHWNKHHKGVLARALVRDRPRVRDAGELLAWAAGAGLRLESVAEGELDLLV